MHNLETIAIFNVTCAYIQLCVDEGNNFLLAVLIMLHEKFIDDILRGVHELLTALKMHDQLIRLLEKVKLKPHK